MKKRHLVTIFILLTTGFVQENLPAQDWIVTLTITGTTAEGDLIQSRIFGGAALATEGFEGFDTMAPPPGFTFTSYFWIEEFPNYLFNDIRGWATPYDSQIKWELHLVNTAQSEVTNVSIAWDRTKLPQEGNFTLDPNGLDIDMRVQDNCSFTGNMILNIQKGYTYSPGI